MLSPEESPKALYFCTRRNGLSDSDLIDLHETFSDKPIELDGVLHEQQTVMLNIVSASKAFVSFFLITNQSPDIELPDNRGDVKAFRLYSLADWSSLGDQSQWEPCGPDRGKLVKWRPTVLPPVSLDVLNGKQKFNRGC